MLGNDDDMDRELKQQANLPLIDKKEQTEIQSSWMEAVTLAPNPTLTYQNLRFVGSL